MNHWLKWYGYVILVSQIFTLNMPVLSIAVAGYTVKIILFYLFIAIVNVKWWIGIINRKTVGLSDLAIILMEIFPIVTGLAWGWSLEAIIEDAVLWIMPLTVYQWVRLVDIRWRESINVLCCTVIAASVVSVLVALRIIQVDIWAAEHNFVRSAGAVDSTLGIGGFGIALILLYVYPDGSNKKEKWLLRIAMVASMVLMIFTQSRVRIVLALILVIGTIIYNLFNRKSRMGSGRLFLLMGIVAIAVINLFPQVFSQILDEVTARFLTTSSSDINISARNIEKSLQLECFWKSPIIGMGWGCRSQFDGMYVHNIYTALLMHGGLLFGGMYILWFITYFFRAIKRLIHKQNMQCALISGCFLASLVVLGITNGGIVQSGGYMMMVLPFLDEKMRKEKRVLDS